MGKTIMVCSICFDGLTTTIVDTTGSQKLFEMCNKHLHSAIISEADKYAEERNSLLEKQILPLCEKCFQSAVDLSALIEQLEFYQKNVSELILTFSLGILHRRRGKIPTTCSETKTIKEFDVSGFPDLLVNNLQSAGGIHRQPTYSDHSQPILPNKGEKHSLIAPIEFANHEIFHPNELIVGDVNQDDHAVNDTVDYHRFSEIVTVSDDSSDETFASNNQNRNVSIPKDEIASSPFPIVRLERLESEIKQEKMDESQGRIINVNINNLLTTENENQRHEIHNIHDTRDTNLTLFTITPEFMMKSATGVKVERAESGIFGLNTTDSFGNALDHLLVNKNEEQGQNYKDESYNPRYDGVKCRFKCKHCRKGFRFKSMLLNHEKIHLGEKPFLCTVCKKRFSFKQSLVSHSRIHTGEKPFQCNVCKKRFTFQSGLCTHVKVCQKRFSNSNALQNHSEIHIEGNIPSVRTKTASPSESEFKCDVCNKVLASKASLLIHTRSIHTGEKPFECSVCSKSFSQPSNLNTHMKVHTKPFKCSICDKRFSLLSSATNHQSSHHTGEHFQCNICELTFMSSSKLNYHIATQHSGKKFQCRECGKISSTIELIKSHYKRVHFAIDFTEESVLTIG